jgi:hypothetical protein
MIRLSLVACALLAGCGLADFDIDQPVPEQMVMGSGIPTPLAALFPIPISLDLSSQIKKQTTGPIGTITLSKLTLSITATDMPSGDTDDWSFVTDITVSVSSSKSGSSLPKVKIASIANPGAVQSFDFDVEGGVDIKPYVDEGSVVESEGHGMAPADDVSYAGQGVFTVHPL